MFVFTVRPVMKDPPVFPGGRPLRAREAVGARWVSEASKVDRRRRREQCRLAAFVFFILFYAQSALSDFPQEEFLRFVPIEARDEWLRARFSKLERVLFRETRME